MMKPKKATPEERAYVDRLVAQEQAQEQGQGRAGAGPRRRGHRSSSADGPVDADTPDDNPQHTEE